MHTFLSKKSFSSLLPLFFCIVFFTISAKSGFLLETAKANSAPTAPTNLSTFLDQSGALDGLPDVTLFSAAYNDPDVGNVANKYELQIATDQNFSTIVYDSGTSGTSMPSVTATSPTPTQSSWLTPTGFTQTLDVTYYWRIKFWDSEPPTGTEGVFSPSGASAASFINPDVTAPVYAASIPTYNQTNANPSTNIVLDFTDLHTSIDSAQTSFTLNGTPMYTNGVCQTGYSCSTSSISQGTRFTINPAVDLTQGGSYTISYTVKDTAQAANTLTGSIPFTVAASTITPLTTGLLGTGQSLKVGSDSFSRIAYQDANVLKFLKCNDAVCSSPTISTVDNNTNVGEYASLALGSDGFGRIAYYDANNTALKFARCTNDTCSSANTTTVDTGNKGQYTAIAMGLDGFARIVYYDAGTGRQSFAKCLNADCTSVTAGNNLVFPGYNVGSYNSMVIGADGFPVITTYYTSLSRNELIHCLDDLCSTKESWTGITTSGQVSAALSIDGLYPAMVYRSTFDNKLRLKTRCSTIGCPANHRNALEVETVITDVSTPLTSISAFQGGDGFIKIAYTTNGQLTYISFEDEFLHAKFIESLAVSQNGGYVSAATRSDKTTALSYINVSGQLTHLSCSKYTTCQTSNGPLAPTGIYINTAANTAQSGLSSALFSISDASTSVFSALYSDPEADTSTQATIAFTSDVADPHTVINISPSATFGAVTSGMRTPDIPLSLGSFSSWLSSGKTIYIKIRFYDSHGVAGPYSVLNTIPRFSIANPTPPYFTHVTNGNPASHMNIIFGNDGFPIMTYADERVTLLGGGLYLVKCHSLTCATFTKTKIGTRGFTHDIKLGPDGFPRVVFEDSFNHFSFLQCTNAACTTSITTPLSTSGTRLLIGNDGFARITSIKSNFHIELVRCLDAACTSTVITDVEASGTIWAGQTISTGSDGFLRVLLDKYNGMGSRNLVLMTCTNIDCTSNTQTTLVTSNDGSTAYNSQIIKDSTGNYVIVYQRSEVFHQIRCITTDCSVNTDTVMLTDTNPATQVLLLQGTGVQPYLALDSTDHARLLYSSTQSSGTTVHYLSCTDLACSSTDTANLGIGGYDGAMIIDTDDTARIFIGWMLRCTDSACSSIPIPSQVYTSTLSNTDPSSANVLYTLDIALGTSVPNGGKVVVDFPSAYSTSFAALTPSDIAVTGTHITSATKDITPETNTLSSTLTTNGATSVMRIAIGDGAPGGLNDLENPSVAGNYSIGFNSYSATNTLLEQALFFVDVGTHVLVNAFVNEALIFTINNTNINLTADPSISNGENTTQYTVLSGSTNALNGYSVYAKLDDGTGNARLSSGANHIASGTGENAFGFEAKNIGYASNEVVAPDASFSNNPTLLTSNGENLGVTAPTNAMQHTVYYGLNVDYLTAAGNYTGTITYTAVGSF